MIDLIEDPNVGIDKIAEFLDGLDHETRLGHLRGLNRRAQATLYEKAKAAPDLTVEHYAVNGGAVEHFGKNTLPLTKTFTHFSKVFCRAEDGKRLFGYNASPAGGLIGPGYFVGYELGDEHASWRDRGSLVIDYFQIPDAAVPDSWPDVVPNSKGLQRFVYHRTRDFMRRVSTHASIGAAYKADKAMGQYFTLCKA